MTKAEKEKMVCAMEFIARHINDESILKKWLMFGVCDGDISYGEMETSNVGWYTDNEDFHTVCSTFLECMKLACINGGLVER